MAGTFPTPTPPPADALADRAARLLRQALDVDPLLDDQVAADPSGTDISDLVERTTVLTARLAALPPDVVSPTVRQALQGFASGTRQAAHALVRAVAQAAAPRESDPRFPVGTWVTVGPPPEGGPVQVPEGTLGRIDSWQKGQAMVAFELPLHLGDGHIVPRDESTEEGRAMRVGYHPFLLRAVPGRQAVAHAGALPHPEDRALALGQVVGSHLTPHDRQYALVLALAAISALRNGPAARQALAALILGAARAPGMEEAERREFTHIAAHRYVGLLHDAGAATVRDEVRTIALLERATQDRLLQAVRTLEAVERAEVLVTLGRLAGRPELLEEARALSGVAPPVTTAPHDGV